MIKGKTSPNDSKPNEGLQSFFVGVAAWNSKMPGPKTSLKELRRSTTVVYFPEKSTCKVARTWTRLFMPAYGLSCLFTFIIWLTVQSDNGLRVHSLTRLSGMNELGQTSCTSSYWREIPEPHSHSCSAPAGMSLHRISRADVDCTYLGHRWIWRLFVDRHTNTLSPRMEIQNDSEVSDLIWGLITYYSALNSAHRQGWPARNQSWETLIGLLIGVGTVPEIDVVSGGRWGALNIALKVGWMLMMFGRRGSWQSHVPLRITTLFFGEVSVKS